MNYLKAAIASAITVVAITCLDALFDTNTNLAVVALFMAWYAVAKTGDA